MERLPATRTQNALTHRAESIVLGPARLLGRSYRGTHHGLARYAASEIALYNDKTVVVDGAILGGVIYLLTCAPLLVALMTFGLLAVAKMFYYLGHSTNTEVGVLPVKFAARVLTTINVIVLVAITTLRFVSNSHFKGDAYLVLVCMLLIETISVLTWYTWWALRDQKKNMRTADYESVVQRTGRRFVIPAMFVVMQASVFVFLA